jgi:hypothetical protein
MFNPTTAVPLKFYMPSVQAAASTLGVEVNATPVHAKDEIEGVIAAQARDQGSLIVMPDPFNASLCWRLATAYRPCIIGANSLKLAV